MSKNINYRIFVCDDKKEKIGPILSMISTLQKKFSFIQEPSEISFKDILTGNNFKNNKPDLLILDLYDEESGEWLGIDCLDHINASCINVPTIIYSGDKDGDIKKQNFKEKYSFVICDLDKIKDAKDGLKSVIISELTNILPDQYFLFNEFDSTIQFQIASLGRPNLNDIIYNIKEHFKQDSNIILERMVSGYSGAILFKFNHQNTDYILKVSNDVKKLEEELKNASNLYQKFPPKFFNYISHQSFYSNNKNTIGILIGLIHDSQTLFDVIRKKSDFQTEIEPLLKEIFTNNNSLKSHYSRHKGEDSSWPSIFNNISGNKFSIIQNVIRELFPLLSEFNKDFDGIENLVVNHKYKKIDLAKTAKIKPTLLCHGDLHARNILIQDTHAFLIDTGGIKYDYWCADICRLIVNLYINGIDYCSLNYYDIHRIKENIKMVQLIINQDEVPIEEKNSNFIQTINWLTKNVEEIYGELYCKFDFQLGLMKELLQISYRIESIPPNKRAIALLSANECLLQANDNINI